MANNDVSVEDEELRHYIWLQVDLATRRDGHPLGDNTVNESTKNLMEFIKQREHEAELRGRIDELKTIQPRFRMGRAGEKEDPYAKKIIDERLAELTAPTTNDAATDGSE